MQKEQVASKMLEGKYIRKLLDIFRVSTRALPLASMLIAFHSLNTDLCLTVVSDAPPLFTLSLGTNLPSQSLITGLRKGTRSE